MERTGYLDLASDTDFHLFAGIIRFVLPITEQMGGRAAFFMRTSCAYFRFHAGMLICMMPLFILVTKKST